MLNNIKIQDKLFSHIRDHYSRPPGHNHHHQHLNLSHWKLNVSCTELMNCIHLLFYLRWNLTRRVYRHTHSLLPLGTGQRRYGPWAERLRVKWCFLLAVGTEREATLKHPLESVRDSTICWCFSYVASKRRAYRSRGGSSISSRTWGRGWDDIIDWQFPSKSWPVLY